MTAAAGRDVWADGEAYEAYVGRWSRAVAADFLDWIALPQGLAWADVGCGAGALAGAILDRCAPASVTGVDPSAGYLGFTRQARGTDQRLSLMEGRAEELPLADAAVDAAVSGLVLNFVPDQAGAVAEIRRVVRSGGTVALYVWDYAGEMQLMRHFWDAAVALDPAARDLDEGVRFPVCRPEPLAALFADGGFMDVETRAVDVPTVFRDFDDYWSPFLGGQGPAPGYCVRLAPDAREALRERLRAALPIQADGSIPLIARAWAVRGQVP